MAPSYGMSDGFEHFRPYVPVARRASQAARASQHLKKRGRELDPVLIEGKGRVIANSFWGEAWCTNLESYSDFANRLPRGRTYARNGSVIDLRISEGRVTALVQGRDLYEIEISVKPLAKKRWKSVVADCAGGVGSLVELLRGKLSQRVMQVVTRANTGLFPAPAEITMSCSCPDWALMCKHVAASLYGVGARLDRRPELLFTLRGLDPAELVTEAAAGGGLASRSVSRKPALATSDLAGLFGIEIAEDAKPCAARPPSPPAPEATSKRAGARKAGSKAVSGRAASRTLVRRSGAELARLSGQLDEYVRKYPGQRMEEIAAGLGAPSRALSFAMKKLIATRRVRPIGRRRGTHYFPLA
jgi:uncharacterized Zn finger protein